jgi:hypothetical protein
MVPSCVAVHVTLSALPPPDPWPITPDHVPVGLVALFMTWTLYRERESPRVR